MRSTICLFIFIFLLPSAASYGEEIRGKVLNAQGYAVAGTTITVSSDRLTPPHTARTTVDGSYTITDLQPGTYTVTVSPSNLPRALQRTVLVTASTSPIRADFQLPQAALDASVAAEEYNPNIFIFKIDQNELRNRLQTARGPDPQYVPDLTADQNHYGAEFGASILKFEPLRPRPLIGEWRGTVTGFLQNSVLNARNFFNVGPLLPSRVSSYGLSGGGPVLSRKTSLLLQAGQTFTSGWVNGNVQEPQSFERTPQSADARVAEVVAALLKAYPASLPNLPGVSPRQLNGNAKRSVRSTDAQARMDWQLARDTTSTLRYSISDYYEDPFQIVIGQNPETYLRSQSTAATVADALSASTTAQISFSYDRTALRLQPTHEYSQLLSSLGYSTVPDIQFSNTPSSYSELYNIGPGPQFPRRRVQNQFRLYSDLTRLTGRHIVKAGGSVIREQVNDLQSDNARGALMFGSDFGRSATQNFLNGTASKLTETFGNLYRGYRYWEFVGFFQDQMRLYPGLTLSVGARYELTTTPVEVNNLDNIGLRADKNNVAPRVGFAWNPGGGKIMVRGSYGISYGTIPPATYGFTRFNEPTVHVVIQSAPDLLTALGGGYQESLRSARYGFNPDTTFSYSHQYGVSIERTLPGSTQLRFAYFGSRSFHLLTQRAYNRAAPDPRPICNTPDPSRPCNNTKDIDARRPDSHYFGIYMIESNGIAYYDAAQASLEKRLSRGLAIRASYTFGKVIDTGSDFTNNATNGQNINETGLPSCEVCSYVSDLKGPSHFDTPQAASISYSYSIPSPFQGNKFEAAVLNGWQVSGTSVFQSGTPFHVHTGSDAPNFGNVDGESGDRPNLLNTLILGRSVDNPDTSASIIKASFFNTIIPPGGRGNLGMNTFRKKGTNNTNLALGRTYRLPGDRMRTVQFRTEFFNLFNRPQFDKPGVLLSSAATFGKITNTVNKGRQVQLMLRLNY